MSDRSDAGMVAGEPGRRGVLIIAGPTGSGKTELAIELAERAGAEIVGADSRQIYRGMPIGTAAPSPQQLARVAHHLVGFLDPLERYSAARFATDALAAIDDIHARGRRAIVSGGTGFYLRALCGDVTLAAEKDDGARERLLREAQVHPVEVLHAWLASREPFRAAVLASTDRYRVARALEVSLAGERASNDDAPPQTLRARGMPYRKLYVHVDLDVLEARIARRTDAMLAAGLIDEAERVGEDAVAADAVGYADALAYTRGWLTFEELRTRLARSTRRYAKRQRTWFRREPDLTSVAADVEQLERLARTLPGWV